MSLPPGTPARVIFDEIYSALDRGKFSDAIRLCQRNEVAKLGLAQALLSYCFATTRQVDKALEIARVLLETNPSEESVFNALGCTFKLCRADGDFARLYENVTKQPTGATEYNLFELFFCYGRMNDAKKMQQVAQRIYKITDNARYLFWSVSCMLLQKDLPPAMLIVAEKMLKKVFFDLLPQQAPGAEELHIYLVTIIKQGKLEEAITAIKTLTSRVQTVKITDDDHFKENVNLVALQKLQVSSLLVDIYWKLGNFQEVLAVLRDINAEFPDQWNSYELQNHLVLFSLGLEYKPNDMCSFSDLVCFQHENYTSTVNWSNVPTVGDRKLGVQQYQTYLQSQQKSNPRLRGPYLAELYFITACVSSVDTRDIVSDIAAMPAWKYLSNLLQRYITMFETKYCCFSDIKLVLFRLQSLESESSILGEVRQFVEEKLSRKLGDVISSLSCRIVPKAPVPDTTEKQSEANAEDDLSEDEKASKPTGKGEDGGAAKSKKKRGKKKKPSNGDSSSVVSAEVKKIDKERIQNLVSKEEGAVVDMCLFCQLEGIRSYCCQLLAGSPPETTTSESFALHQKLFLLSHLLFKNGIGGELRIVQPGDDLLLLNSSIYRKQYASAVSSTAKVEISKDSSSPHALLLQWCSLLHFAVKASAYSYALKIDMLEASRLLGVPQLAWTTFSELGVKNIQHDSLSYLVLPTLIEQGWWVEAIKQSRTVLNCEVTGKREALDMLGKAFEFGNFNKVLELNDFAEKTSKSLQLAVAKAELPIFELAQNKLTLLDATVYLQDYLDNKLPESAVVLSTPEINKLICNVDFGVIDRNESIPKNAEAAERDKSLRKLQLHHRITVSQLHTHFWANLLCESYDVAQSGLASYLDSLKSEEVQYTADYAKFSQSIRVSPVLSRLLNQLLAEHARLFLGWQQSLVGEDVTSLCLNVFESVNAIKEHFAMSYEAAKQDNIANFSDYLSDASSFLRCAVPVISLALQSMTGKFVASLSETTKNAFANFDSNSSSEYNFLPINGTKEAGGLYEMAYNWTLLLDGLEKQLTGVKAVLLQSGAEGIVDKYFDEDCFGGNYVLDTQLSLDTSVFREHALLLCSARIESSKLTVERFCTLLSERVDLLVSTCKEVAAK